VGAAVDFTNRTDTEGWTSFTLPIPSMSIEMLNLWVVHDGKNLEPAGLGSVNSQCNAPVTQDYARESFTIQFWSFLSSTAATSSTTLFTMEDFHAGYTTQTASSGEKQIVLKFKNAYSPEGAIFIIPTTEGNDRGKWVHWSLVYDQGLPRKAQLSVYRFGQKTPSSRRSIEEELLNGYVKRSPALTVANASAEAIDGALAGTAMPDTAQFATSSDSTDSDSTSHAVKFSDIRLWKRALSCQDPALLRYWSQPDVSLRGYDDFGLVGWYRFDPNKRTKNDAILGDATETALVIKGTDNSVSADKPITGSVACSFRNIGFQNKAVLSFDADKAAADPAFKVNDIVDQGDCPDGYEPIVDITECQRALAELDLSEEPLKENELPVVTRTHPDMFLKAPYGCYLPKKGNYAALFNARSVRFDASGDGANTGRIEVQQNGVWGTVCDDYFDDNGAKVACRAMGKEGGVMASTPSYPFPHASGQAGAWGGTDASAATPINMDDVKCIGTEASLDECPGIIVGSEGNFPGAVQSHNCGHHEDVAVCCGSVKTGDCTRPTTPTPFPAATGRLCEGKGYEVRVCKKPADAAPIPNIPLAGGMAGFTHNQCKITRGQDTAARFQLFHTGDNPLLHSVHEDVKQRCVYSNGILVKQLGTMDHTMQVNLAGHSPGRRLMFSGQKTWDKALNTDCPSGFSSGAGNGGSPVSSYTGDGDPNNVCFVRTRNDEKDQGFCRENGLHGGYCYKKTDTAAKCLAALKTTSFVAAEWREKGFYGGTHQCALLQLSESAPTITGQATTTAPEFVFSGTLSCSYARCMYDDLSYDPCTEIGDGWRMEWPEWGWQSSYGCRSIGWGFSAFGQYFLNYGRKPTCIKPVTATCPLTTVPDFPQGGSCELVALYTEKQKLGIWGGEVQNPSEPKCRYIPFAESRVHDTAIWTARLLTAEDCPSGYQPITAKKECEDAASYLNYDYVPAAYGTLLTSGCHKPRNSYGVSFNPIGTSKAADGIWEKGGSLVCVSKTGQNPPRATVALKGSLEANMQLPLKSTCEVLYGGKRVSKMNAVATIDPKFLSKILLNIKAHPEGDDKDGYSVQCNAFAARQNLCFTTSVKDTAVSDINYLGYQCVSAAIYDGQPLDFRPWMTNYGVQFSFMDTQTGESGYEIVRHQSFQDIHLGSVVVSIPYGIRGCGRQFASVSFTDEYAAEMPGRKFVYGVRSILPTAQAGAGGEGGSTYKATEYLVPWISAFTITIGPMRPFVTIQVCRLFHVDAGGDPKKPCTDALSGITASGVYVWYTTSDMFGVANLEISVADNDPIMGWDQVNQRFLVTPLPKLLEENCDSADGSVISPACLDPDTSAVLCTVYEPPNQVVTAVHRYPVQAVFEDVSSRIVFGIVKFDPLLVQQKSCMVRGVQVLAKAGTAKLDLLTDDHGMFNFSASVGDIVEIELIFGDHVFTTSEGKVHSKEYFTMGIAHVNLEFYDVTHRSIGLELRDDTLNYVINSSQLVWGLTAICGDDFVVFNRTGQDINRLQQDTVPALTYRLPALVYAVDITGAPVVEAPAKLPGLEGAIFKCTGDKILQITDFFQTLKNNLRIADLRHQSETLRYVYRMGFCASFSLGSFNPSSFPQKVADPCGPEGAELCESEGVLGYCLDTDVVTQEQNKTLVVTAYEQPWAWASNADTSQLKGLSKNNVTGTVRISEAITGDDSPCHPRNGEFVSTCLHDLTPTADAWSTYSESMVIGAPPPTTGFMREFSITVERVPYDHDCDPTSGCDITGTEWIAAALDIVTITRYIPVRGLYKEFGPPKTVTVPTGDRLVFNVLHDPPGGE
jgi:hypothetical protein